MREYSHGLRSQAKFRLDLFILSPLTGNQPQIWRYFQLQHSAVEPSSGVETKRTTNLPLSRDIKSVATYKRLHGEVVSTTVPKRDG